MKISDKLRKLVDPNNTCCCDHCLSNKCREWILTNSDYDIIINDTTVYLDNGSSLLNEGGFYFDAKFTAPTEPEAVFKAFEYVLTTEHKRN